MLYEVLVTSTVDGIQYQGGRVYTLPPRVGGELVRRGVARPLKRYDKIVHPEPREVKHAES